MEVRCLARTCVHWQGIDRCSARGVVLSGEGSCRAFREAASGVRLRGAPERVLPPGRVTYRLEMVSCGKCVRCRENGPSHGPYWYAYWKEGGVTRSRYLGKGTPVE
ncbi:MAG: hypothetical protein K6T75_07275 [Acetobacteraceae bacterium]|nr:hypothetical protein [Acetobacteraceae bacterium]